MSSSEHYPWIESTSYFLYHFEHAYKGILCVFVAVSDCLLG